MKERDKYHCDDKIFKKYKKQKLKDGTYTIKEYKGELVEKEDYLHEKCMQWFFIEFGDWKNKTNAPMLCHIANETPRSSNRIQMIAYNRKMRRLGKITGISDFFLRRQDGQVIFIELKSIDSGIKDEQKVIYDYFNATKKQCFVCKTVDQFADICDDFLNNKSGLKIFT